MTRIVWNEVEKRYYEFGVDRGVFYPQNSIGYPWSGLISVKDETVDTSQQLIYIDGVGHANELKVGSFSATIDALHYPKQFEPYDGYSEYASARSRRSFDFCYRTMQDQGHYKIHLVYNALATPTERNNSSVNATVEMELFSWKISTRPVLVPRARPSAHFEIDTRRVNPGLIEALEEQLYGSDSTQPSMPTITDLLNIFEEYAIFHVVDNGDGTATIWGPDEAVHMVDADTAEFEWPSVIFIGDDTYEMSSL